MKKIIISLVSLFFVTAVVAQIDSTLAPYKRFPSFPPVKLLLADSVSIFTKDNLTKKVPSMLLVFSPDCDHCKHETEDLITNIDKFKDINIVMATMASITEMNAFVEKYKLAQYSNITIGKDFQYFLGSFYRAHNLPFLAFYNKKKELISIFEGSLSMEKALLELAK